MDKLGLILLVFSFVCAVLAIFIENYRAKLVAACLAFLTAAMIFGNVGAIFK